MSKNQETYAHVFHMADEEGVWCNSKMHQITTNQDDVTCNKCKRFISGELDLIKARKARKKREEEAAEKAKNSLVL